MKSLVIIMVCILLSEVEQRVIQQDLPEEEPPRPKHRSVYRGHSPKDKMKIARSIAAWSPEHRNNVWELSGHYEGDIVLHNFARNGVINKSERWPKGVIPYYIIEDDFADDEKDTILAAMNVFNKNTCVKFRPYTDDDPDFITIQSKDPGCYSFVGHLDRGQVVNFHKKCMMHGTLVHEFLHVLGFYHQHSAQERDDYIKINWENIKEGKENQFGKLNSTNFGEPYDYNSVMHYSSYAFSKNFKHTIQPFEKDAEIGQRDGASKIDLNKVRKMYGCKKKAKHKPKDRPKKESKNKRHRRRKYIHPH